MVGFLMGGCSLNIPLEDQFSDPDAITDVLSARSLLASAYEGLPQHLSSTRFYRMIFVPPNI